MSEALHLICQITRVFAGVPGPGSISLRVARGCDDYESAERQAELRKLDEHTEWGEVTDQELEEFSDVHPFLDVEALRFYLPAFMIWCIKNQRTSSIPIAQWTIMSLWTLPGIVESLTPTQRDAVAQFLGFAADHFDQFDAKEAQRVYALHWKQYDQSKRNG